MDSFPASVAQWATVLRTIISIVPLIQSRAWITISGVFLVAVSTGAVLYAKKEQRLIDSATITVDGRKLDSLNAANLARRRDRKLMVQKVAHVARIDGPDVQITWRYAGYCRVDRAVAIEFSTDAANNIPFDRLQCFAYDLKHDPERKHKIRPLLVGADGISKKIAVPFLQPLKREEEFDLILRCELPGCMNPGVEYYSSTLSFDQPFIPRCVVRLMFVRERPDWVRVYEGDTSGGMRLAKDLPPVRASQDFAEYCDVQTNLAGQSASVYVFRR
jgi:hypothetical protein